MADPIDTIGPDEAMRRVQAALAEAGYPDAGVRTIVNCSCGASRPCIVVDHPVPDEVVWMAYFVAGIERSCWECWSTGKKPGTCTHEIKAIKL